LFFVWESTKHIYPTWAPCRIFES